MNDLSYIVVLAITVLLLVMQMKKYMDLKRIVKNVADVRVIEGNRKIQYVFFLLAIASLAVCAVLLVVPLHLEDKNSFALFAWVLCVVFLTNAISYATTQCLYETDKQVYIGNHSILKKKISHVQNEQGKPCRLVLVDGEKINISAFQAEVIRKGFVL
ncbi:hypothetical protein [Solobacterium moorei]|uniref:hypothetical protein n=1 Tax=Solobacterium moorei TaxID=102148 RepID=UPI0028E6C18A|nr:hypothetical protein [Solobacterium moorei]